MLRLKCYNLLMGEGGENLLGFVQALGRAKIEEHEDAELEAFEYALRKLTAADAANLVRAMAGRRVDDETFYRRMNGRGWVFAKDELPVIPLGGDEHGMPYIGSTVSFPGGSFSATLNDVAHVVERSQLVVNLFCESGE